MDVTMIVTAGVSAIVTVLIKAIWDWVNNKNGKKEIKEVRERFEKMFKDMRDAHNVEIKEININYNNQIKEMETDLDKKIELKFSYIKEVKQSIDDGRKEFVDLKDTILTSYVKKHDYEKLLERVETVRDTAMRNENNISMVKETARQNVQRISQLEAR